MRPDRVYIIGPMRNRLNLNFPTFRAAAADLLLEGRDVRTLAEDERVLAIVTERGENFTEADLQFFMRISLENLLWADWIVALRDWSESEGARYEHQTAEWLGLRIQVL